ncbi:MAG: GDP-mannose 4,6-dehydratase [Hyphomicrobiales bacterium]|nr:GDP-mannose 4,6-dehydratase [Hyphomicrobiales bacterium]MDE2115953.1 GDP-mannose 4,6-dehydratase [Hyphomicrobiales bacterium]
MRVLVTGSAGFIGFHLCQRLLREGHEVMGLDGFTPYYDTALKHARHAQLMLFPKFTGHTGMLEDAGVLAAVFAEGRFDRVYHLAAQTGVRYSLENPRAYIESNILGTFNLLEMLRIFPVEHFLLASTSSVYGGNAKLPFCESDATGSPLTLYAASKISTEAMAASYSHLWQIPTSALRFFTVYGPWGRPDMALFKFTKAIIEGAPIEVYNSGRMRRDFTYVTDLVEAMMRLAECPPIAAKGTPFQAVNLGAGNPVELVDLIAAVELAVGKKALRRHLPMQKGDMLETFADVSKLKSLTGYVPTTSLVDGVGQFVEWYRAYHQA